MKRADIIRAYKEVGNIDTVAKSLGISRSEASAVIVTIPSRDLYRHRGNQVRYSDEELLEALRVAAEDRGEPLSSLRYQRASAELGLPSHMTIIKRFSTWTQACQKAGVKVGGARPRHTNVFSPEDCYQAISNCSLDLGHWPSYNEYEQWARKSKRRPSGPTVRVKCKSWAIASDTAHRRHPG